MFNKIVFIIAELSANHNNNFDTAVKTIKAIADSGADAVKVQTYKPESLTLNINSGLFAPRTDGLWKGYTSWDLYSEAAMPYEWQPKLKKIAEESGLIFFSSPFDFEAVDFLESINNPIYKIASFEVTDIPLIEYAASKRKPMIISTGVAEIEDIESAIDACRKQGNDNITLLKCTSQYPATIEDANLLTIPDMRERFGVKVGLSDHTMGHIVAASAVALGATVVEKHFIIDRTLGGPDSSFSMEPDEFRSMVNQIRQTEKTLGRVKYEINEKDKKRRRSLFITDDIKSGEIFTEKNLRSIRPGNGLSPKFNKDILGKKSASSFEKGTPLEWKMIKKEE
jgi:pseudaminic acid synthase